MVASADEIEKFIDDWSKTGGSELANTQSFVNGLCAVIGVEPPMGSRTNDTHNDYVFERRVFQLEADGTESFGRIDAYKRNCFILEAKQGSEADRAAAEKGEADLDIFGQTAAVRVKRGTARRGTPAWSKAMDSARGQAERYAKALPIDHGWPPFLLVTDVGYCIDVYADFSGTGKQYTQFPDAARFRIMLPDLRHDGVRDVLAAIWTNPSSLDASREAAKVTREIADKLAELSKRLENRENDPARVADFLMRCLFTMFAEDVGLIPKASFTTLLRKMQTRPENLTPALADLWAKMDKGGFVGALGEAGETVRRFNGYLLKDQTVLTLKHDEIALLLAAAEKNWDKVEPAIFGTLLERALGEKERARLGAHYTPRAYVERLVIPTVIEPLRADWDGVRAAAGQLIDAGKPAEAKAAVEDFHGRLARTRVLDPACGTGNFLYVALARMKELEGEVVALLTELGDLQYVAELSGHTITPENFLGIEINPRAAAIAQLVLWIGYLQWHFRVNGPERMPPEPILRDVRTIENRDALITWDSKVLERGPDGKPLMRWDGETMKVDPVTGKKVPDETARVDVWRYLNPKAAKWPMADFIVGNPPFIGNKRMRDRLGDGYFVALRRVYPKTPGDVDFVLYWWAKAAQLVGQQHVRRSGLITTNSLRQSSGQVVVKRAMESISPVSIVFAIADHPWRDTETDAAVRVAMTVVGAGQEAGRLVTVSDRPGAEILTETRGFVHPDLTTGTSATTAVSLKATRDMCFMGVKLAGDGFRITPERRAELVKRGTPENLMPMLIAGSDVTRRPQGRFVIDAFGLKEHQLRDEQPALYQHLRDTVRPGRQQLKRKSYRDLWWIFAEPRPAMRKALASLSRAIVTSEVSKHATFVFADVAKMQFDGSVIVIASDDAYILGVLSSRFHEVWKLKLGGRMGVGNDPRYQSAVTFDPFPFPVLASESIADKLRGEAEALDALRKRVLTEHEDLTLTALYNVLAVVRDGRALTDKERDVHDRGLITLIRERHDAIDALVADAYGWGAERAVGALTDGLILERLVALNRERAAEEAQGVIRWLRPEYQAPGAARMAVTGKLDLDETPAAQASTILAWPKSLPEQVSAVAGVLADAPAPMSPRDVASAFAGKRAKSVEPVLGALAAIGRARKLSNGRYAI